MKNSNAISPFYQRPPYLVSCRDCVIRLDKQTKVMGIINATPDSFSGDGVAANDVHLDEEQFLKALHTKIETMIQSGADILDIGGESTRPGAAAVSMDDELNRVIPLIRYIINHFDIPISIDTYKPDVAKAALSEGAAIVNCIQGTPIDPELVKVVRDYNAALIIMHIRGTPTTMQDHTQYQHLIKDIKQDLFESLDTCQNIGLSQNQLIIDPGIGFAKTVEQNYQILHHLNDFHELNYPILIGPSRKSFIGKVLDKEPHQRVSGTLAACTAAVLQGAHIVRVHDCAEVKDAVTITDKILSESM